MARRLKRIASFMLSAAFVALPTGFGAQLSAAQVITGRAASVAAVPVIGLGAANAPLQSPAPLVFAQTAPSLSAPSVLTAAPLMTAPAPAALGPAGPAAAVFEAVKAAAPALQALAKPETGGSAAGIAGRELEDVLTGAKSVTSTRELPGAFAGVTPALTPALSPPSAVPGAPNTPEVPALAPAPLKSVDSFSSYSAHRFALKAVAVLTGAVFTLPQASPALSAKVIASAADKALVLSDFDDTLAGFNEILPADKVAAVAKIRAAGKHFAVISDRADAKRPGSTQLTVFESLESLPVDVRAGMYVAANSGGKVYRYDERGVPQKVHEAVGLTQAQNEAVRQAAAATKARLAEAGAVQHAGDEKNPAESFNTYGYAIMLKPGSSQDAVKGVAKILNEELAKRGLDVEVQPRFAKSPENPPYATFSIITKAEAAAYIAGDLDIAPKDALVIGDSMFIPREPKKEGWLSRLGERLSGRPQVKTGNETDRNMTKLLPGVLALGVGAAMDPRTPNGWALAGRGPVVTQTVLEAVASKPRRQGSRKEMLGALLDDVSSRPGLRDPSLRAVLSDPNESYSQALKQAREIAVARGSKAEDVRYLEATASLPVRDGAQWKYAFSVPNAAGGSDLISVDFANFLGGAQDFRARVYKGAAPAASAAPFAMSAYLFGRGVTLTADEALGLLRASQPTFGAQASVSLAVREESVSGDKDAWYRFYDAQGSIGEVNVRTSAVRVVRTGSQDAPGASWTVRRLLRRLGLAGMRQFGARRLRATDDDVRAAAAAVIAYKGRPWSMTEYNAAYYPARAGLKSRGATTLQLALFETLCADAPVKGGSFNPWSGD